MVGAALLCFVVQLQHSAMIYSFHPLRAWQGSRKRLLCDGAWMLISKQLVPVLSVFLLIAPWRDLLRKGNERVLLALRALCE
mmetsp:Transcript_65757/g.185822  ORF Transcript_65757/g.185822 Transcript_65757/m.185822 type:complete len:82 (+) Transcript_65757:829-1074(+)